MSEDLEIKSIHIQKLGHKIQEVRERALESLLSKLKYGFKFDNKLVRSQETLQLLFQWFSFQECQKQEKVLALMRYILKSPTGQTIIQHIGTQPLIERFKAIECRITIESASIYDDIIKILGQENGSDENDDLIPPLCISSIGRSEIGSSNHTLNDDNISHRTYEISQGYDAKDAREIPIESNLGSDADCIPKPTSVDDADRNDNFDVNIPIDGIKVFLLPWIKLWPSDARSLFLVAEALMIKRSVRRCCRFLIDVLSKDFPANVFLNRPSIVKSLLMLISEKNLSTESMEVLMVLVNSIKIQIKKLYDVSLVHSKHPKYPNNGLSQTNLNYEERKMRELLLQQDEEISYPEDIDERVLMLHQLPVPYFCLDFMTTILENLALSAARCDDSENDNISLNDFNLAVSLCLNLLSLFLQTVTPELWKCSSNNKITEQIMEKSVEVMRYCGETLNKLNFSAHVSESKEPLFRIAYYRLLNIGLKLGQWCGNGDLISPMLTTALQKSLQNASYAFIHQGSYETMTHFLGELFAASNNNKEIKMYTETLNVCLSITDTTTLLKMHLSKINKDFIPKLLQSVTSIEFHNSRSLIQLILGIITQKLTTWKLIESEWSDVRKLILSLFSHNLEWVQEMTYLEISSVVSDILGTSNRSSIQDSTLEFLLHESVFSEICCHGLSSHINKVSQSAKEMMTHFLRGKLLLSESTWRSFIEAITPVIPVLHGYAAYDDLLGSAIIKSLELKIGRYMLIPQVEIISGNVRLLFVKCYSANLDAANNIVYLLQEQDQSENLLPKISAIRPDALVTAVKNCPLRNVNIPKSQDDTFYNVSTLSQVMELLGNDDVKDATGKKTIDASFRRSALSQLSVMLQQASLHGAFISKGGCELVYKITRLSLDSTDISLFPECAKLSIGIFNCLCARSIAVRHWAAKESHLLLYIIRAIYIFHDDKEFLVTAVQSLMLISYGAFIINNFTVNDDGAAINSLALPFCLTNRLSIPFECGYYWKTSTNQVPSKNDWLYENECIKTFIRIHWNVSWYGGVEAITRWPYVPVLTETDDFSTFLKMTDNDLMILKLTCPIQGSISSLYRIQNSTTHSAVNGAICSLFGYLLMMRDLKSGNITDYIALPWRDTFSRFLIAPPASPIDAELLNSVLKFLNTFIIYFQKRDIDDHSAITWILKIIFNSNSTIMGLLSKANPFSFEHNDELDDTILKQEMLKLLVNSANYHSKLLNTEEISTNYEDIVLVLVECLKNLNLCNFHTLGYLESVIQCTLDILLVPSCTLSESTVSSLIGKICEILNVSHQHQKYNGFKGLALLKKSFMVLCCMVDVMVMNNFTTQAWNSTWFSTERMGIFKVCLKCLSSESVTLRAVVLQFFSGLASVRTNIHFIDEAISEIRGCTIGLALSYFLDTNEASLVRVQAAHFLVNLIVGLWGGSKQSAEENLFDLLHCMDFEESIATTAEKICDDTYKISTSEHNISAETLLRREEIEVAISKQCEFDPILKVWKNEFCGLDAPMVTAIADVISALILLNTDLVRFEKNHYATYRIIFRCLSLRNNMDEELLEAYSSICKMLAQVVSVSTDAAESLLDTIDCVSVLLRLFIPVFWLETALQESVYDEMLANAFVFLGNLLSFRKGFSVIWKVLYEDATLCFFETLLITIRSTNTALQRSSTFCLTKLLTCALRFDIFDNSMRIQTYIDVTPAPISYQNKSWTRNDILRIVKTDKSTCDATPKIFSNFSIESMPEKCVISEELSWIFTELYKVLCMTGDLKCRMFNIHFEPITSAICAVFAASPKARAVAVEKKFLAVMLKTLIELHNFLTEYPSDVIKEVKNSPTLFYLNRVLQIVANCLLDCEPAKENVAEGGFIYILGKIWQFCIMTEELQMSTVSLLQTYTNNCLKACQTMHVTTSLRSLLAEVIDLLLKEMALVSSRRDPVIIYKCLKILENSCIDAHCRFIILKSHVLSCINKLHPAFTKKRKHWTRLYPAWEQFLETLSRYPNGQEKIMEYSGVLCALIHQSNGLMVRTLSNCAFSPMNRVKFLQSAEIICIFCMILTSDGPIDNKVLVCIMLWALAANNHKSKLILKNAGVSSKVEDCSTKLKLAHKDDVSTDRAIQILDYVSKILFNKY